MGRTTVRDVLTKSNLDEFKKFIEDGGWTVVPTKGEWEVLRAEREGSRLPIIVYKRKSGDELTTFGPGGRIALAFRRYNHNI